MHLQLSSRPLQAKAFYQRDWHHAMCHYVLCVSMAKQLGNHGETSSPSAIQTIRNQQDLTSVCPQTTWSPLLLGLWACLEGPSSIGKTHLASLWTSTQDYPMYTSISQSVKMRQLKPSKPLKPTQLTLGWPFSTNMQIMAYLQTPSGARLSRTITRPCPSVVSMFAGKMAWLRGISENKVTMLGPWSFMHVASGLIQ